MKKYRNAEEMATHLVAKWRMRESKSYASVRLGFRLVMLVERYQNLGHPVYILDVFPVDKERGGVLFGKRTSHRLGDNLKAATETMVRKLNEHFGDHFEDEHTNNP